jgi:hypothetical protein
VEADAEGAPLRIYLSGMWQDVTLARKPWRIDQHWWRADPVQRRYFRVLPVDSPPLTIYYDMVMDSWYRQEYG